MSQLSFSIPTPPTRARRPLEPIVRTAEVEQRGDYVYRWTMQRAWGPGPTALWALLNPSVADGKQDDPTTLRMMGFSYRWGFGSMIVVNLYPFVSSTTDRLLAWRKTFDWKTYEDLGMRPWPYDDSTWSAFHHGIGKICSALTPEVTCIAAWGSGADEADVDQFLRSVKFTAHDTEFGSVGIAPDWHCLGKTADGSPIHPLARGRHRVPDDRQLSVWKRRPLNQKLPCVSDRNLRRGSRNREDLSDGRKEQHRMDRRELDADPRAQSRDPQSS